MPIIEMSGDDAVATRKENPFATWGNRVQKNRVEPITKPWFPVPFQMESGERIFTVGSCFARHVEVALIKRGFKIPMRELFKREEFMGMDSGVVNNFGTPSIYNEFAWALGVQEFVPSDHIIEVQKGKFVDMHVISSIRPADYETVIKRRTAITEAYRSFAECRVIVITLGLVEVWYDSKTDFYLNSSPRPSMLRKEPERFKLHVLSYEEAHGYLEKTINLIRKYGRDDVQIIVTVSPVPLTITHRKDDVIVANSYSKSLLRVIADTVVAEHNNVTYYPSYESIMLSNRQNAWLDDFVHVTDEIVALNINRMVDAFVGAKWSLDDHRDAISDGGEVMAVERASKVREGPQDDAAAFFNEFAKFSTTSVEFALDHAQFLTSIKDFSGVISVLNDAPADPTGGVDLLKARTFIKLDQAEKAFEITQKQAALGNKSASFWTLYLDAAKATNNPEDVIETLNQWTKVVPKRAGRANGLVGRWFHDRGEYDRAVDFFKVGINFNGEDALIRIYFTETLLAKMDFENARNEFQKIKPQLPNEAILYERLKPRIRHEE